MTPPDLYRRFVLPIYQRRGRACREAGKVYAVHLDGRLAALKALIAESTFDVVESFSLAEMAGDVPVPEALASLAREGDLPELPGVARGSAARGDQSAPGGACRRVRRSTVHVQISEDIPPDSYASVLPALCESLADLAW